MLATAIKRKLTVRQIELWECFYETFLRSLKVTEKCTNKKGEKLFSGDMVVLAHNLACEAVWELQVLKIVEGKSTRKRGDK
jgi:hypothetical protein